MIAMFSKKVQMNIVVLENDDEEKEAKEKYPQTAIFTKKEIGYLMKQPISDSLLRGIVLLKGMFDGEMILPKDESKE